MVDMCSEDAKPYLQQFAYTAVAAANTAISYIIAMSSKSIDDTFRYVAKRQHELMMEEVMAKNAALMEKLG